MLSFRRVQLSDKDRMTALLQNERERGCEYTFGNIFIWHDVYCTDVAFTDDGMLIVRFACTVDAYLFPVGSGDLRAAIEEMMADAQLRGTPFRILAASERDVRRLEELFPGRFNSHLTRDYAEYVYNSEDLIELRGKKFHGKRNHIAQFTNNYPDYSFEEFTRENIAEARAMSENWYRAWITDDATLTDEMTASNYAFNHFFELDLCGGFVRANGQVVAFAIGEPINAETFCVHLEKASYDVTGAYTVINRDFARHFCASYRYINREDDMGLEGLRRAKLSYNPAFLSEKYVVNLV